MAVTDREVSMMDVDIYAALTNLLSTANDARCKAENRAREPSHDKFGDVHLILFGDFKCLP